MRVQANKQEDSHLCVSEIYKQHLRQMAMSQNPVNPVNIPIPTKLGSKIGGEFTCQPKWYQTGFDPNCQIWE